MVGRKKRNFQNYFFSKEYTFSMRFYYLRNSNKIAVPRSRESVGVIYLVDYTSIIIEVRVRAAVGGL